jgi:hypothetical protein
MNAQAHQVLVYSGPGVSPLSLSHTILTLSLLLLPHYTVQPITPDALHTQPWEPACALLVVPGGRDLPFVEELSVKRQVTKRIKAYVEGGGRYLGICAGAYFGAEEVKFDVGGEMEVVGKRDLVSDLCLDYQWGLANPSPSYLAAARVRPIQDSHTPPRPVREQCLSSWTALDQAGIKPSTTSTTTEGVISSYQSRNLPTSKSLRDTSTRSLRRTE